jgi:hypothetical protein
MRLCLRRRKGRCIVSELHRCFVLGCVYLEGISCTLVVWLVSLRCTNNVDVSCSYMRLQDLEYLTSVTIRRTNRPLS